MNILGMPLWRDNLSDEQFVERARKRVKAGLKLRYVAATMGVFLLFMVVWLISFTLKLLGDMDHDLDRIPGHGVQDSHAQAIFGLYTLAITMGFTAGFMLFNALSHLLLPLFDFRKDKLLVEFWDALSDAERTRLRQKSS